jgi:hypothetical protein
MMGGGGRSPNRGLILHTNIYTFEEVQLLMSVLTEKYGIVCTTVIRRPGQ